jgi:hypothetical protein
MKRQKATHNPSTSFALFCSTPTRFCLESSKARVATAYPFTKLNRSTMAASMKTEHMQSPLLGFPDQPTSLEGLLRQGLAYSDNLRATYYGTTASTATRSSHATSLIHVDAACLSNSASRNARACSGRRNVQHANTKRILATALAILDSTKNDFHDDKADLDEFPSN